MLFSRPSPAPKSSASPLPPPDGLEAVALVRSPSARRLALRVDPARGRICLVVPRRVSDKTAWAFADSNRAWIAERLTRLHAPVAFAHDSIIPVFGRDRRIDVTPCGGRVTSITLHDDVLAVHTPRPDPASNIRRFLIQSLDDVARPIADAKARAIGKSISALSLRDTRTRWGSCGPDGQMMLCWRLVFAPLPVIDYVIAHEVAHLRHMDHSPRFWALCESLCEDMPASRKWLAMHGESLLKYGASA